MSIGAVRQGWSGRLRWPPALRIPFYLIVTGLVGLVLLYGGTAAILQLRSYKYLGALIVAGVMGCAFLILPRKFTFFLYCAGFTLPFFVEVILLDRTRSVLAVTGTLLVCSVLAVVGFATGAMQKSRIIVEPRIAVSAVVFICACFLSLVNTTDRTLTLIAVMQELEMLFIFLVLTNAISQEYRLIVFLRGLYLGFVIECIIYYIQNVLGFSFDILGNRKWGGITDVEAGQIGSQRGTFANAPATAALYFSLLSLLLAGLYLSRKKLPIRIRPALGMILGGSCLVLSAKRAAMSGFALGAIVMLVLVARRASWALPRLAKMMGVLAIPVLIFLPIFMLRASANHEAAYEERANLTRVAWNMYHAHPIVGVGFGTYDTVKRDYLPPDWEGWLYTVHTRYLLVLSETGLVGFSALILLYVMVLMCSYRGIATIAPEFRPAQIALFASVVALYWEQVWDIFNSRQQGYLFWMAVSLAVILPRALPQQASGAEA